jgi:CheY-like chemotaxis protein
MELRNKIMIVDDNPIDQMMTMHILKKEYINEDIIIMESALMALEYLEQNQNDPIAMPSLIILDLDMPEMNGLGFLNKFSTFQEAVKNCCKIVVLTASNVAADIELMKADPNVVKLITKPLSKNALVPMIVHP